MTSDPDDNLILACAVHADAELLVSGDPRHPLPLGTHRGGGLGIALWPTALVPTWFGISRLVASMTGYSGCPELGAIPSVMLARPVPTDCGPWVSLRARTARPPQIGQGNALCSEIARGHSGTLAEPASPR